MLPAELPLSNPINVFVCGVPFPPLSFLSTTFCSDFHPRPASFPPPDNSVNLPFGAVFAHPPSQRRCLRRGSWLRRLSGLSLPRPHLWSPPYWRICLGHQGPVGPPASPIVGSAKGWVFDLRWSTQGVFSRGFHTVDFFRLCRTLPTVEPVATVWRQAVGAELPPSLARKNGVRTRPHGETAGAVAGALAAPLASIHRQFPHCIPSTYPTYPTKGILLKTSNFPQFELTYLTKLTNLGILTIPNSSVIDQSLKQTLCVSY